MSTFKYKTVRFVNRWSPCIYYSNILIKKIFIIQCRSLILVLLVAIIDSFVQWFVIIKIDNQIEINKKVIFPRCYDGNIDC